jgi:2-dehydro-3-deoxyglucarate aldolase
MPAPLTIGSWLQLADPALAEMMARGPFDWLTIDLEHTSTSISEAGRMIRIVSLAGKPCYVRLSGHDPAQVKRVLDAGAEGVIVPNVNTPEQAAAMVAAATYPPRGSRGVGLGRAQDYGTGFSAYRERIDGDLVVIAQVEHIEGVDNLAEIVEVEGISGFFIGPYDLSASLGHPGEFEHPDYLAAMERVRSVVQSSDKPAGLHVVEPDVERLRQAVADGYRFIAFASDMLIMAHYLEGLKQDIRTIEGAS